MLLVATHDQVLAVDAGRATMTATTGLGEHRPTCLSSDPHDNRRAWCGTHRGGVFRSDDAGASWQPCGLADLRITAIAASATDPVVWVGTEPSAVWRSPDAGATWERTRPLAELASSNEWSFPPRPDTHHVRWIACHPQHAGRLWVAVEAGALVTTRDRGQSWQDRVSGGPYDTHELAIHPQQPDTLRVAAGDGYYESFDGGATWSQPHDGLDVGYLRSVAIDPARPDVVLVSASSYARSAYVAGKADGRIYRRDGAGRWWRVTEGWPDPPATIAPLLISGRAAGELWAADERGVHRSDDGGITWRLVAPFDTTPDHLRGLALVS